MITLNDITLRRGPTPLLEGVTVTVHAGWRVGVVGRNGSGKSSLFAMLLGELVADAGEMGMPRGISIATVAQETPSTRRAALDYVLDGDGELRATQRRLVDAERTGDAAALAAAHEQLAAIGGYAAAARAGAMLHGLGFSTAAQSRAVAEFSGGWRMRLNLARALMQRADLLLLDEPTNHLDLDAVLWLQRVLAAHDGTLLVISHDRDFLDATTTHTLHLHAHAAQLYAGNYSSFELQRAEQLANQAAAFGNQQRRITHLQRFVDRFRAKASKARQAQSRLKMIERMPKVAPVHADSGFDFAFLEPARLPVPLLRVDHATVGYDDVPVLNDLFLTLAPGDRIGLLGANGAGKSTLVKLLAGGLSVQCGETQRDPYLSVGYFAQHQLDQLDAHRSPLGHLQRIDAAVTDQDARNYLGGFAFHGDRVFEPVRHFSGGERARLALALLVWQRPNLLLLDEPTNHLDLDMRYALEIALQGFAGAVVVVSHDRHLIRATCDTLWLVAGGRVAPFDGDLDDYARTLGRRERNAEPDEPMIGSGAAGGDAAAGSRESARERRRAAADRRQREKPLRDEVARLENRIDRLRQALVEAETELADPALYESPTGGERIGALTMRQSKLKRDLAAVEEAWLSAAEALESATTAD